MRASGRHILWRNLRRRVVACTALLAYLAASFGVPVPVAAAPKDLSRPYPCMDRACGCACAEDCWRHCCCMTVEERWAWAEANGIQPPDYAERPAAHKEGTASDEARPCPHCHPQTTSPGSRGVATASSLHCQGLGTLWVTAGTTPAAAILAWRPAVVLADRLTNLDQFPSHRSRTPTPPPPR
jgi:hypothetical protein